MLEAGSNPRVRNRARLTPAQLVDPTNKEMKALFEKYEFASQNAGDFVVVDNGAAPAAGNAQGGQGADESDEDAEFSGSDDEERAEWERRRRERKS